MYKNVSIEDVAGKLVEQLKKGAFLTVKSQDKVNVMTIAWGTVGYIWQKYIFIALVRQSRYTFELIERATSFTISLPLNGQLKEALSFCGTRSGREVDKFDKCGLSLLPAEKVDTPVIDGCDLYLECQTIYKLPMQPELLPEQLKKSFYSNDDYHVLYFGEIVTARMKE